MAGDRWGRRAADEVVTELIPSGERDGGSLYRVPFLSKARIDRRFINLGVLNADLQLDLSLLFPPWRLFLGPSWAGSGTPLLPERSRKVDSNR